VYFWQHNFFGQVHVSRDLMFLAQILIENVDKEYLSCTLNFKTFGNMSQKLWSSMYFVCQLGQSSKSAKITFFRIKEFEIGFQDLYVHRKLGIIPF